MPHLFTSAVRLDAPGLLSSWQALEAAAGPPPSPFMTWQWATALGEVPAVSASMTVLRVADGARTAGLLAVERWRSADGLRVVGPAGGRWLGPDHIDVVADGAERAEVAAAVVHFLARHVSWDLLDLEGLARDGALAGALRRLRPPVCVRLPDRTSPAPYLDLRPREPGLIFPSRNLRQQVARGLRSAEHRGGGFAVCTSPEEVTEALPLLMDLHQRRHGGRSQVFATPERRRFHLEAARLLAAQGRARVYCLTVGGETAALVYALALTDRLYYYSMGMRPDVGGSPGRTLLGQIALSAAAEGFEEFDLLRGDHEFKLRFSSGVRDDLHLRFLRPNARVLAAAGRRGTARLIGRLRQHWGRPGAP